MRDLIESRISEIRELASKLEDATMAMDLKVIRALVTRLKCAVSRAPSDLEALLAEREGMKAEIARLSEHAKEWRDVANQRALEMIDLSADAERLDWLEAEHSRVDPVMRLTVKEHHFRGSPLWANVNGAREGIDTARRLSAPLDPSSAPSETPDWLHGARRCTAFSKSWDEQCQLTDGHAGDHASGYGNVDEQGVIPPIAWTDDIYRGEGAC